MLSLDDVFARVARREPLLLLRYGDGEYKLMTGQRFRAAPSDRWKVGGGTVTPLGADLLRALQFQSPDYFLGFPGSCCHEEMKQWYLRHYRQPPGQVFCPNLFVNVNHERFLEHVRGLDEPVVVVANRRAAVENLPFPVKDVIRVGDACVKWYARTHRVNEAVDRLRGVWQALVFSCAGPLSNVLLHRAFQTNPRGRYLDIGSPLDQFLYGRATRAYQKTGNAYRELVCDFGPMAPPEQP